MRQPSKSNPTTDAGARPVGNWRGWLACDFCGVASDPLYTSERHAGAFCADCIKDVLNPAPPTPVKLAKDGEPVEDHLTLMRKLNAYLKTRPEQPVFCGRKRGRPRKEKVPEPTAPRVKERKPRIWTKPKTPIVVNNFKYFSRQDTLYVTDQNKRFAGIRAVVWSVLLSEGRMSVNEVLTQCKARGLAEREAVSVLRKMIKTYGVIEVVRSAA